MKRPCEDTTSDSDMDETIDVGSENNYSGQSRGSFIRCSSSTTTSQVMARKKRRGIIEKRRRDRINNSLSELRRLVPTAFEKQGSAKLEKAEILQMTVDHLKMLQATGGKAGYFDAPALAMDFMSIGFRECLTEVARYLSSMEGSESGDPLCVRLVSHLSSCVSQREVAAMTSSMAHHHHHHPQALHPHHWAVAAALHPPPRRRLPPKWTAPVPVRGGLQEALRGPPTGLSATHHRLLLIFIFLVFIILHLSLLHIRQRFLTLGRHAQSALYGQRGALRASTDLRLPAIALGHRACCHYCRCPDLPPVIPRGLPHLQPDGRHVQQPHCAGPQPLHIQRHIRIPENQQQRQQQTASALGN